MSIIRKFEQFNEECVVCFLSEGDERIYMPLCGITRCRADYSMRREISPEFVFEYIVKGKGVYQVGDRAYLPETGDIYICHAGTPHRYRTDPVDRWEKIWFNIHGTLVAELLKIYRLSDVFLIKQANLGPLFSACLEEMRTHPANAHETASIVTHRLIYAMSQRLYGGEPCHHPIALELKRQLEEYAGENIQLKHIAHKFGYSESQLIRLFSREYGETPYRYFLRKKLELAMIMLRNSRKSIKEIAAELSFPDQYYFSNLFKRKYGKSPSHFREQW